MVTKKSSNIAATKKETTRTKTASKKPVDKCELVQASNEQCFWVTDGRVLGNLIELRDALESMSDDIYAYHVTKERNDFADWIEYVLQDSELAGSVRKSKKAKSAHGVVVTRLRIYSI